MKTSFYFVLWMLIYPILGLFGSSFIDNHAFFVAFVVVWGVSWLLNRVMPKTLTYERVSQTAPVLEEVYVGNVGAFRHRLSARVNIEFITAVYFILTTVVIFIALITTVTQDWFPVAVFGTFTYGAIVKSVSLFKAKSRLNRNPTPEECREIAEGTYGLDYTSYYEVRSYVGTYEGVLPPKPRYFKAFMVFSTVISVIAILLGSVCIFRGIVIMLSVPSFEAGAVAGMILLYGSVAAYFGVKDFLSCVRSKGNREIPVSQSVCKREYPV